ncbi:MAG: lysophospholipid acyltransferase family protein [Rhizobiaceae bacterium]
MIYLRSIAFNLSWYVNIILQLLLQSPWYFFLSHENATKVPKRWAASSDWLMRVLAGIQVEVIDKDKYLLEDGCIVACKHQSIWEFGAVNAMLRDGSFVLKSELMKIPFFGWYIAKLNHIPIRRGDKGSAMRRMIAEAKIRIADNRQILIFPEGTRMAPGAEPNYRYGVTRLYLDLNCPVVPVALSSGLHWPRRKFLRYPGTLRAKFMEPIMPGLSAEEFSSELERRIEEACDELYWLASHDKVHPPLSDAVKKRIMVHAERLKNRADG